MIVITMRVMICCAALSVVEQSVLPSKKDNDVHDHYDDYDDHDYHDDRDVQDDSDDHVLAASSVIEQSILPSEKRSSHRRQKAKHL